ncbi:MAG TPA: HD domain-containing phosphohydrolase [Micromonosporaceae bacterium]|nr:HD domain-containing phosphohydrolase [Micromonosporaceae bacterium]
MTGASAETRVRRAELLAVLSLGADLGLGQPMEHVLRECLIAMRLAERLGMDQKARAIVYYTALLTWVGCHVDAYEQAKWFGDDLAFKSDYPLVDNPGASFVLKHLGAGRPLVDRARLGVSLLGDGRRQVNDIIDNHRRAAEDLAARLGLDDDVRDSLAHAFERWDGKGTPGRAHGSDIPIASRLANLADVVEVFHRLGGVAAAIEVARDRRGTQFDPELVDEFCAVAADLLQGLEATTTWDSVIAAEPELDVLLSGEELDAALVAIANFIDVKSPYTLGHSAAVAQLAEDAARLAGLSESDAVMVRRAGLVHDLGRLGVSNAIWDKPGSLTLAELERVRLHPYLTERMLAASALAPYGAIAVQHHERLDGSGYPRGVTGDALTPAGRILAAADAYRAKLEPRAHRGELTADQAAAHLRGEVRAGRLDADAVEAVLRAAGHPGRRRRAWPAGLTAREVEVLRLAARGLPNQEIAARLHISRKTAAHHVEHIYTKIGVSNRARASLFAAQHGLLTDSAADDEHLS